MKSESRDMEEERELLLACASSAMDELGRIYRSDARKQYANNSAFVRMLDDPSPNMLPCIIGDVTTDPSPIILRTLIVNVTDGGVA